MTEYPRKEHYTAEDLVEIIRILRDPDTGCPWDKVQTHASIRMNFLEEAYEAVDAIGSGTAARTPQDGSRQSYASMLTREMSPIDWGRTARPRSAAWRKSWR